MIAVANKKTSTVSSHLGEQGKVRNEIVQKGKTYGEAILQKAKKSYKLYLMVSDNWFLQIWIYMLRIWKMLYRLSKPYLVNYCGM